MPLTARFGSLLLALLVVSSGVSSAQTPEANSGQMTIRVTVESRTGTPVQDLTKDDFTLTDNKKPQPITGFRSVNSLRANVIIVLDAVNLPYMLMSFGREQLSQFFGLNEGRLPQPTTLAILEDTGLRIQPSFTTNGNELRSLLDKYSIGLRDVRRSSGVYGADEQLQISLNALEGLVAANVGKGPLRIVWISPGWPLLDGPDISLSPAQETHVFNNVVALTTEMRRSDIVLDAVNPLGASQDVARANYYENFLHAPRKPADASLGNLGLQVLATESGGLVLNGSNDITGLIQHAIAQGSQGYDLTFTPAPGERPNEYHELQIKLRRGGLNVHAISGYYANPVYPAFVPVKGMDAAK